MKRFVLFITAALIAACMITGGCADKTEETGGGQTLTADKLKDNFVVLPSFETTQGNISAGTAFAVKLPGRDEPVVLTASHIFGLDGDENDASAEKDLKNFIQRAYFFSLEGHSMLSESSSVTWITQEASEIQLDTGIVSFPLEKGTSISAEEISENRPQVGDKIWVASPSPESASTPQTQKPMLHEAVVMESSNDLLVFEYDQRNSEISGTDGAPVLNSAGQVVGICIVKKKEHGIAVGFASPAESFYETLKSAYK